MLPSTPTKGVTMAQPLRSSASPSAHGNQVASDATDTAGSAGACADCPIEVCVHEGAVDYKTVEKSGTPNSSFMHSVINIVGITIGLGQLSTPYALEKGGWLSAIVLVGMGIVSAYTGNLMARCLRKDPDVKNYQDLGERSFGRKGRIITSTFLYLEIFLSLVSYTISLSDNLGTIFSDVGRLPWALNLPLPAPRLLTVIAVLVALPSLWLRDLSSISFLSSGGIFMSALLFCTIAWTAAFGGVGTSQSVKALDLAAIPGISGLYVFGYSGHVIFPNIYRAMKNPSQFPKVISLSFTVITAVYTVLAFLGTAMFGSDIKSQITLNMPKHQIATKIALWATVITPMTKYALELVPVSMQLEGFLPSSMEPKFRMAIRAATGSVLLIIILVIALTLPYFSYVLDLTGSLLSACLSIVFPCAFYVKICKSGMTSLGFVFNMFLIALGLFLGVIGTVSSVQSLVESVSRSVR